MNTSYLLTLEHLWSLNRQSSDKALTLQTTQTLNNALGRPDSTYPIIHVAGTNGKGSVVTKISHALIQAGYCVGIYTSPHLSTFRERIQINGNLICEEELTTLFSHCFEVSSACGIAPTFFELTTCAALKYFADSKVDVAVLEVGIGGRLDSTNIVNPLLSVITSISLEHTQLLGNTREAIAAEKGGIIKRGVPVVVGPHADLPVLKQTAADRNSPYFAVPLQSGSYDAENSAIAAEALQHLEPVLHVDADAIKHGLSRRPSCRMELWHDNVILDVGHNPDGLRRLLDSLHLQYPNQKYCIACGFSGDKDVSENLQFMAKTGVHLHLMAANHQRAMPLDSLVQAAKDCGLEPHRYTPHPSVEAGIQACIKQANEKACMALICGSFFIMSEARTTLGIPQAVDSLILSDRLVVR